MIVERSVGIPSRVREGKADFRAIEDPNAPGTITAAAALGLIAGLVLSKLLRR